MKLHFTFLVSCFLFCLAGKSQTSTSDNGLFENDEPLNITIKGNTRQLLNNRTGTAKYFPLTFSYTQKDSSAVSIPVNIKTRGHFRRLSANCTYPPLLIQFPASEKNSKNIFPAKAKLKLVMPCRGDEYIVREWMVYKIYTLLTDESFKARLVKVTLDNEKDKKKSTPFFGILLEEEKQMAKRNRAVIVERKIKPLGTMREPFLRMAVFQYLIGNTDWSVEYLQNVKLIAADSLSIPKTVAYDFDHAGIVGAPYAYPAEQLKLSSCRERRYRGYCVQDMKAFDSTIALFNRHKDDIYKLYSSCTILDKKYVKETIQFLDEFYTTINTPKTLQREFGYPCDAHGTGNVIIKGLRED